MLNILKGLFLIFILIFSVSLIPVTFAQNDSNPLSPLKQMRFTQGIEGIICKQGFILLMKISDGNPACVNSQTAQKLVERGWGLSLSGQQVNSKVIPIKNWGDKFVWFISGPKSCQVTPWNENWIKSHPSYAWGRAIPQSYIINEYFKEKGITVIETRISVFSSQSSTCVSSVVWYFLVPESDANKMIKLGYEKLWTPPPILSAPVE